MTPKKKSTAATAKKEMPAEDAAKKKKLPAVELSVAPRNSRASREVVARSGENEFTDVFNPFKASARERFANAVGKKFGLDDPTILDWLCSLIETQAKEADARAEHLAAEAAAAEPAGAQDRSAAALAGTPADVIEAAEAFLDNENLMDELESDLEKLGIAGETELATSLYIIAISRKLDRPLGATVKSSSSTGKSFVTETVVSLVPEEDVLQATNITPNALYYMPPGFLVHKLVVVGERAHANAGDQADAANASLALREMLSRGRLDKFVPMRGDDGTMKTQHITQEGPIAYVDTTTQQDIFEEDATRMLSLCTNETPKQTRAVMAIQARQAAWESTSPDEQAAIRRKYQTAQRLLEPKKVRIPFAKHLLLPSAKVVARRAFPQLLGFIAAVALLRQRQKKEHDDGHIVATMIDYKIAYRMMLPVLNRTFAPVSDRAKKLLVAVKNETLPGQNFTRAECAEWVGVGLTEVRNRLTVLVEAGLVEQTAGGKGLTCHYKVVGNNGATPVPDSLVTPEVLKELIKKEKSKKASNPQK